MPEDKPQSFLSNYAKPPANSILAEDDEYRAFSFGRAGSRSQAMITFIKKDDYVEAISYANLNRIWSSDINREIKLDFGDRMVSIEGSDLLELFNYVWSNRCSEVFESNLKTAISVHGKQPVVSVIVLQGRTSASGIS